MTQSTNGSFSREGPSSTEYHGWKHLRSRVSYNASARLTGRVIGALLSLVALRLVTHHFGATRWGEVVAASAFANLFVGICDFGLTRVVSREMATPGVDSREVYGGALIGGLLVSSAGMAVMTLADLLVYASHPQLRDLTLVLVLSVPPNAAWVISSAVLIARARNDARGVIDVTSSLFLLAASGATVAAALGVAGYLWLTVAADAATGALGLGIARRYVRANFRSGRRKVRELLRQAFPLGLSQALISLAVQLDVVLLALLAPLAVVGRFGVALQLAVFGTSIPTMVTAAILPKFVEGTQARKRRLTQRAFDVLNYGGAAVPLVAVVFARPVMVLIAGRGFAGGASALMVLGCYAALWGPAAVFLDGLVYLKTEGAVLKSVALATVTTLVAAAVLIPLCQSIGAAIALLAGAIATVMSGAVGFKRAAGFTVSVLPSVCFVLVSALLVGLYVLLHLIAGYQPRGGWLMLPEMVGLLIIYGALAFGTVRSLGLHHLADER